MAKSEEDKVTAPNNSDTISSELVALEQELLADNPLIFQGIPPKTKEELLRKISMTIVQQRTHSGPLPDADALIKYNSVIPNGADRIMTMAEKQQVHRMEIEKKIISSQANQGLIGQIFGFIIGLFGILCGSFLAYQGFTVVGSIIAGGTVVSLVSVFVIGKKLQKSNE